MQKVTIVTNYFPPEIGAASNRIYNLAKGLKDIGYKVEVIAPLPNYPEGKIFNGYKGKFYTKEEVEGIIVRRFWVYPTVSKNQVLWNGFVCPDFVDRPVPLPEEKARYNNCSTFSAAGFIFSNDSGKATTGM